MGVWVLVEDDDGVAQDASLTLEFWAKWDLDEPHVCITYAFVSSLA